MKPNFCPNCGEDTEKSATFCANCGFKLIGQTKKHAGKQLDLRPNSAPDDHAEEVVEAPVHRATTVKKFKFIKVWLIWLISASIVITLIGLATSSSTDNPGDVIVGALFVSFLVSLVGAIVQKYIYSKKHKQRHSKDTTKSETSSDKPSSELNGVSGWLGWFTLGLGLTAILCAIALFTGFSQYDNLASLGYGGFAWFEILANSAMVVLAIWTATLIFKHKRLAVTLATVFLITSATVSVIDSAWASSIRSQQGTTDTSQDGSNSSSDTGRAVLAAIIWIPYFQRSRRVKATLVK